ncbi:MAG TPA: ubiquinol oxidase subunit II [Gammaproteobacteria bacterium]|nr:ubiquinol oxidase subunit II [Gammaproteobacteria bacterium]
MTLIKKLLLSFITLLSITLLSGCHFLVLNPTGWIAVQEKHIFLLATLLMLIIVVPVIALSFIVAWRFKATRQAAYDAKWAHNTWLEIIWWTIPCVMIVILSALTWTSTHQLDPYRPLRSTVPPLTIQVIALEWQWLFIYPEQKIATTHFVQLPVNTPVTFLITAAGPMNSFQIPQIGGQIYAMAGMQSKLHLIATQRGDYQGFSANFSGQGFADMKFTAHVSTRAEFDHWVKEIKKGTHQLTQHDYDILAMPNETQQIQYFAKADPCIFETVIMKSMMPMKHPLSHCQTTYSTEGK